MALELVLLRLLASRSADGFVSDSVCKEDTKEHASQHEAIDYQMRLFVDGQACHDAVFGKDFPTGVEEEVHGMLSGDTLHTFRFGKLKVTDDDELATQDERIVKGMSTIKVVLSRARAGARIESPQFMSQPGRYTLHEKIKKGLHDHDTSFGMEDVQGDATWVDLEFLDDPASPWVSFEFKYGSGDLLEARGIKPAQAKARRVAANETEDEAGPAEEEAEEENEMHDRSVSLSATPPRQRSASTAARSDASTSRSVSTQGTSLAMDEDEEEVKPFPYRQSEEARLKALQRENARLRAQVKRIEKGLPPIEPIDLTGDDSLDVITVN